MNRKYYIIIALWALSCALYGQSDRVKTVETRDSASLVSFENNGTGINSTTVQGAIEELEKSNTIPYQLSQYRIQEYSNPITIKDTINKIQRSIDAKIKITPAGEMRMYFIANRTDNNWIDSVSYYYQYSLDKGITWQYRDSLPFFTANTTPGALDAQLWEFNILFEDSINWKMYYQGAQLDTVTGAERYRTFLATSSDGGSTWVRQGLVLDVGADRENDWDGMYAGVRSIFKHNGKYWMYYEGNNARQLSPYIGENLSMGLAISSDGINFTKMGKVLEMNPETYSWETNSALGYTEIVDSVFIMLYGNNTAGSPDVDAGNRFIGMAISYDGLNFERWQGNPIIDLSEFKSDWNSNRNAFVSFTSTGKNGYYITTRGTPGSIWDNGLYFWGNNWDDFYHAQKKNVFVSEEANINKAKLGEINFPYPSLQSVRDISNGEQVNVFSGNYIFSGPYSSDPASTSLTKPGLNKFYFLGSSVIRYENTSGNTTPMFSDVTPSFGSSVAQQVKLYGPTTTIELDKGPISIGIPFGYYDIGSDITVIIDKISATGGRSWAIQTGAGKFYLDANKIDFEGDLGIGINVPNNAVMPVQREYVFNVNDMISRGLHNSTFGLIRIQDIPNSINLIDSLSSFIFNIKRLTLFGSNDHNIISLKKANTVNTSIYFKVDEIRGIEPAGAGLIALSTEDGGNLDTIRNSTININIKRTSNELNHRLYDKASSITSFMAVNSTINVELGDINFSSNALAGTSNNPTCILINTQWKTSCEKCHKENSQPYFLINNFLNSDTASSYIIEGNWETTQSGPIVSITTAPPLKIILRNFSGKNDGTVPIIESSVPVVVYVSGAFDISSSPLDPDVSFVRIYEYAFNQGPTINPVSNVETTLQVTLDSLFSIIPKHSATLYQSTLRQYTFPTPATVDTITIDTLSNALITDSITQDTGYIRNISYDTMRWQVSYSFFRDSDEDALSSFIDLTTDGTDAPEAIPGSRAYSEQAVANGTQHAGPTFTVDVPPGDAIRLCVYGSSVAAGVDISDLTISVQEIYRE